ncbi:hypothetical protein IC582_012124 [Cucumis melo]|uniref:Uncharacterized protein LOC103483133 isoform X1 n=1 Tax=Cucumis melo TaxID=3656 RepID=A0A1S3AVH2_CUCME|nr:uncharacterized protein LOC103483133 isoform X1 [Cucumis melo]
MESTSPDFYQNLVVLRHADRLDFSDHSWTATADRPWDPPLMEDGFVRAFNSGRAILNDLGSPIHRIFVSPFLRCLQTAAQVVAAVHHVSADSAATSQLKVSIEYGLCEKLNHKAIPPEVAPKDWNWGFNISDLQTILPTVSTDHSVEPIYEEAQTKLPMPQFGEVPTIIRSRFEQVFKTLADRYHSQNIMLITHGIGVGVVVSTVLKNTRVVHVDYCGYAILRRPIFLNHDSFVAGNFELCSPDDTAGIKFSKH